MDQQNLRRVMNANAAFSGVSGTIMVLFSNLLTGWMGLAGTNQILLVLGFGLVGFALFMAHFNNRPKLAPSYVLSIIVADSLWVLGSILLLVTGLVQLSSSGLWAVGLVALVVDVFATLQFIGWRQLHSGASPIVEQWGDR